MYSISRSSSRSCALLVALTSMSLACEGDSTAQAQASLEFSAQRDFLSDLDYDTGWLPDDSPAAVRAVATGHGSISVSARADATGEDMSPVAGSGELTVGGGLSLEVSARVDTSGLSYEGVVDTFEYEIEAQSVAFDPFLLEDEVAVENDLPPAQLASVPIPSLPGATLIVDVTAGRIETSFAGTCADTREGTGQFTGIVTTGGEVSLAATIEAEIPLVGSETFGPFEFDIEIPSVSTDVDLGTRSLSTADAVDGVAVCGASDPGAGKSDTDDSDPSDDTGEPDDRVPEPNDDGSTTGGDSGDAPSSCAHILDGVCDEPEGTGACDEGTDVVDCAPAENDALSCNDGRDNDADNRIDCHDPDCAPFYDDACKLLGEDPNYWNPDLGCDGRDVVGSSESGAEVCMSPCVSNADCPPAQTGTAPASCEVIGGVESAFCVLRCGGGFEGHCPVAMVCTPEGICAYP
jgi:hypothetical protein